MLSPTESPGFFVRLFDRYWGRPSWWNLFVTLPWAMGLVFFIYAGLSERAIAQRERTTEGRITQHEPQNHNRYGYTFSVNGRPYHGWTTPQEGSSFAVDQQVIVFYDSRDATRNALTDFNELSLGAFGPIPILLFGIGAVALFIRSQRRNQL